MPDTYGRQIAPDAVRFERLLPGPIERVWAYLTESEKRGRWLASGSMELRPGGAMELFFKHSNLNDDPEPTPERFKEMENGHLSPGRVLLCEPPRLLRFTWEGDAHYSEVQFELTPEGDGVRLVLTHSRLDERADRVNVSGGWHTHLTVLEDELSGRTRRPFWSAHQGIEGEYETRLPA